MREAIESATQTGAALELAKTGIAVPIIGADSRDLAAWVLPLDSGLRTELATPFSAKAAVFLREIGDTSPLRPARPDAPRHVGTRAGVEIGAPASLYVQAHPDRAGMTEVEMHPALIDVVIDP